MICGIEVVVALIESGLAEEPEDYLNTNLSMTDAVDDRSHC